MTYFNLTSEVSWVQTIPCLGGSPSLVVMGGDSRSEGCGLESQRHFFTLFVVKLCLYLFEKTENKQKRGRGWPIKNYSVQIKWNFPTNCARLSWKWNANVAIYKRRLLVGKQRDVYQGPILLRNFESKLMHF